MIKGFVGTTLIDFPGKIASVLFLGGCNFRCPFCHNPGLVTNPGSLPRFDKEEILDRLRLRHGFCDGVVVSGGEPLLHGDLPQLLADIKALGYAIKLDTNGYYPERLAPLLQEGLVDAVAMDIKTSPAKYPEAAGLPVDFGRLERSIRLLKKQAGEHEFRTTAVPGLVEEEDIRAIAQFIQGARLYTLQPFVPGKTLDPAYLDLAPHPDRILHHFADLVKPHVEGVRILG